MSSKKDLKLFRFLEKISLDAFYEDFRKEKLTFADLEDLDADDIEGIFKKKVHRKRFLKSIQSQDSKTEEKEKVDDTESLKRGMSKKKEEHVHIHVKCKHEARKVYDIPLNISNEDLISRLIHAFIEGEVRLTGDEIALVKELKSYTIKDWRESQGEMSPGKMVRAILDVKSPLLKAGGGGAGEEELEMLRSELAALKAEKKDLEKSLKSVKDQRDEAEKKLVIAAEKEKSATAKARTEAEKLRSEKEILKKEKEELEKRVVEKEKEDEANEAVVNVKTMWTGNGGNVAEVYDVPVGISNEALIGKLLQAFLTCEVKLHGGRRPLVANRTQYTLKKWLEHGNEDIYVGSNADPIRMVLHVKGASLTD